MLTTSKHTLNTHGFNLSILECKFLNAYELKCADKVLIYPYWNVNWNNAVLQLGDNTGFNLSILECK